MGSKLLLISAAALFTSPAFAHVTIAEASAPANASTLVHLRVGHGCSGSPTVALKVEIPAAIASARPQAKPGWTIALDHAPGNAARITAVTWKNGSLDADAFDDFGLLLKLPAATGPLSFPATQTCANGVEQWRNLDAAHPAPVLNVAPASGAAPMMDMMPGMDMGKQDR
jgi:uncharacterized protein YcnI